MIEDRRLNPAERVLKLFTDVRPGEASTALLLTANVFLLLCAYSLMKVLREPLILAGGGAEVKSYSAAGQALLLLVAVPLYGALANRFPRRRLINVVTTFFLGCLIGFFVLARTGASIGVYFYIWLGIFNVMVIAQFWSFANDLYTSDEGKRLFPIVAFGQSCGAVVGAYLAGRAIDWIGLYPIFLVSAAFLVLGTLITNVVDTRERKRTEAARSSLESTAMLPAATREVRLESGEFRIADLEAEMRREEEAKNAPTVPAPPPVPAAPVKEDQAASTGNAFQLVLRSRYLLLIGIMILLLNWVNSTGEYILGRTVSRAATATVEATHLVGDAADAEKKVFIGKFYSNYQLGVNLLGLFLQLFVVSRILKYFGVRAAVMVLPAIALFGYGVLAFVPVLGLVRWVKTAENATDYSIQNTVRQVLFLPTTREQKYKAK
ncbi:MAG: NTP/NDP exchange transporter, partial [Candidatus Eiseniibacteriota bacterium]